MLILLLLNTFLLARLLFRKKRKHTKKITIEYYDGLTPEEFDELQYPELRYEILTEQYDRGLIHKADYDKAIENLIKDITI